MPVCCGYPQDDVRRKPRVDSEDNEFATLLPDPVEPCLKEGTAVVKWSVRWEVKIAPPSSVLLSVGKLVPGPKSVAHDLSLIHI